MRLYLVAACGFSFRASCDFFRAARFGCTIRRAAALSSFFTTAFNASPAVSGESFAAARNFLI